ncbi:MAG: glycosyltransferase family 4 protein [Pseudorhodobacter sp.]|nr:glycosyltransferase family 4 protein [Pseudorhodobacter sp.]
MDVRILQTARALQQRKIRYLVAVLEGAALHGALQAEGLAVHAIARGRADPRIVADLCKLVRQIGATVIDAHNMQSQYWGALAALACRVPGRVATVHSVYRDTHPKAGRRHLHEYALHTCSLAGFRFLTVSTTVTAYLRSLGIPPSRIAFSWNGIAPLREAPPPYDLHAETGWPQDAVILGVIGRLEPVKGLNILLDALHGLVAAGDRHAHLLIAGTGRDEARLKQQASALGLNGRVHFAGFRQDVTAILTRIDLFCLPSLSEGLPYSLLEAARQGVPVLSSRLDGPAALFHHNETIWFVPPNDIAALQEALHLLVTNPAHRRRIGEAARRFAAEQLSIERMIDETLAAYRPL